MRCPGSYRAVGTTWVDNDKRAVINEPAYLDAGSMLPEEDFKLTIGQYSVTKNYTIIYTVDKTTPNPLDGDYLQIVREMIKTETDGQLCVRR